MIVFHFANQGDKASVLQDYVPAGVGPDILFNPKTSLQAAVGEVVARHICSQGLDFRDAIPLYFRKEFLPIGYDHPHVPHAGRVQARVINLVEDAVTDGKPDPAGQVQGCTDSTFCAGSPTW